MTLTNLIFLVLGYSLLTALFSVVAISVSVARAEIMDRRQALNADDTASEV